MRVFFSQFTISYIQKRQERGDECACDVKAKTPYENGSDDLELSGKFFGKRTRTLSCDCYTLKGRMISILPRPSFKDNE